MSLTSRTAAAAIVALVLATPLQAGQVKLEIRNGLVTLDAKDASVREILAEWARVGQTRILNAERVPASTPLTLQLIDVPEPKALDILLRSVAGYVAAPRAVAVAAASQYDRIAVMTIARPAASAASPSARTPAAAPAPIPDRRGRMGAYPPQPAAIVDDDEEPANPQAPAGQGAQGSAGQPFPGMAAPGQVSGAPNPNPYGVTAQPITPQPASTSPGVTTQSAPRPGMMTAPPPKPPGSPDRQ